MTINLSRSTQSKASELAAAKAEATARVNEVIGNRRTEFITPIPGQEMIYREKVAEARAYQAELIPPVDLGDYPFMAQEVGVTAVDADGVATVWLAKAAIWKQIGSELEGLRQGTLAAIAAAADLAALDTAVTGFETAYAAWTPPV